MLVSRRYNFFSSRRGPVAALRVFRQGRGAFEAAFARHDAVDILRELAADSGRGERVDLVALSGMVETGLPAGRVPTPRLLDGLIRAVDRGGLVLLRGWGTPGSSVESPRGRAAEQLVARAMAGASEIAFDGERYVVKTSVSWRELPDRQLFEAVRPDVAHDVLGRLAARPRWTKEQRAALEEVATKLADGAKPASLDGGLVLLRRGSFGVASFPEEAAVGVTPSQLIKQHEEVEKVDPMMDGTMVELDLSNVELPVESDEAEATEESEDDGAREDAEASEAGGEAETSEPPDDSSDTGPQ